MIRIGHDIWLCLRFPDLALEVFTDNDARPLAVIEQQRVYATNAANLEPGLALTTEHALCADLLTVERQPRREQETLRHLAHWAYQFTPAVGVAGDDSLLLEIGGCRRLHGGTANLLALLREELEARGHRIVPGLAHTPKAAWLLARTDAQPALHDRQLDAPALENQLAAVPVARLPLEEKTLAALQRMGIAALGELLALPQPALGKRCGVETVRYLQQLCGRHPDPQPAFAPAPAFERSAAFVDGVHNRQMLLFPMKNLVRALCDYLAARQLHCRALRWQLWDARRPQAEITLELALAQNRWRTFLELSQLKLETLPLRDAVYTLTLSSDSFSEAAPGTLNLFGAPSLFDAPAVLGDAIRDADAGAALLDRLQARLGRSALQRLDSLDAHWPEATWRPLALAERGAGADAPDSPRPLWLLPAPAPLQRRNGQLLWGANTPLELLRGPERIGNHWWQEAPAERDYYIARHRDGVCWIFRERDSGNWFVHGLFA